jgi:hypothetical protein
MSWLKLDQVDLDPIDLEKSIEQKGDGQTLPTQNDTVHLNITMEIGAGPIYSCIKTTNGNESPGMEDGVRN